MKKTPFAPKKVGLSCPECGGNFLGYSNMIYCQCGWTTDLDLNAKKVIEQPASDLPKEEETNVPMSLRMLGLV